MTVPSHQDMASARSLDGEARPAVEVPLLQDDMLLDWPQGIADLEVNNVADVPDTLIASTELGQKSQRDSQYLQPTGQDNLQSTEHRSKSWPAVPRSTFSILQMRVESFQRRSSRLQTARDQAFAIRMQLKFLRNNYRQQHEFVDESQRKLNDHIEAMMKADDFVTTRDEYLLNYARARDDYFRLEEQSGGLQALEDELTNLEVSIQRQEASMKQTSEKILGLLLHLDPTRRHEGEEREITNAVGAPSEQFSSEDEGDHISTTTSLGDPFLADYFDKAGDVKIATDRLIEVLKDQEERRIQRNYLEDQESDSLIPQEQFEYDLQIERNDAEKAIRDAITLRDKAKSNCIQKGINPEDYRHGSEKEVVDPPAIMTQSGPFGELAIADEEHNNIPPVNEHVEKWIEQVGEPQFNPLPQKVQVEENTPRKSSPSRKDTHRRIDISRRELERYLGKHIISAEMSGQLAILGLDLPSSTKRDLDPLAGIAASSTLSGHSRASSESKVSYLFKTGKPHDELIAGIHDVVRGRRR